MKVTVDSTGTAKSAAEQGMTLKMKSSWRKPSPSFSPTDKIAMIGPHFNATEDMISIYHGDVRLVWNALALPSDHKAQDLTKLVTPRVWEQTVKIQTVLLVVW